MAPSVFNKAMDSEAAGKAGDYIGGKVKEAWNAFNPTSPDTIPVSELSNAAVSQVAPQGFLAAEALGTGTAATAAPMVTTGAHGVLAAEALGTGMAATAAPVIAGQSALMTTAPALSAVTTAAPMLGPFGIPILIGAGLYAANQGK
jgi:hypothetical protein